jgi:hypothetical protein
MLIIAVLSLLAWVFVIVFVVSIWTAGKLFFIDWPRRPILR